MKTVLTKIDELDMKINSLKKRRVLIDNRVREYEGKLRTLTYKTGLGGEKTL